MLKCKACPTCQKNASTIREEILTGDDPVYTDETTWRHLGRNSFVWELATKDPTEIPIVETGC